MKKFFAVLLSCAMMISGAVALAETVTMGTNAQFQPFEYIGDDGKPTGFDVEVAEKIAEVIGMELKIEDMYFDGLLSALDMGQVDIVIAAMTITPERKAAVNFSDPYFNATQAVIVMKGYDGIQAVADLKDKKIAVQDGTTGHLMATDPESEGGLGCDAANVFAFKASPDTVLELTNGRVDCIIIDNAVAESFMKENDQIEIVQGLEMPVEEYGIAVKKGNDALLASINEALAKIKEDGTYDELIAKYFAAEE